MAEYLVIRLAADDDESAMWIAVNSDGTRLGAVSRGSLAEAAIDAANRDVLVLVPGGEVLTTTVDIPVRNTAKLLAALPYALEEMLAEDVEDLHFAAGTRQANGRVPVAAVSHERMTAWLDAISEAGLQVSRLIPEQLGLAAVPGTITLLIDGDELYLNDGGDTQLYFQDVTPTDALTAIGVFDDAQEAAKDDDLEDNSTSSSHLLVYCSEEANEEFRHEWAALRNELSSVDVKLLPDGALPRLAVTVATGGGLNLLQARYGPKTSYGGSFAPWRYAAMLLVALLVAGTAGKAVNYLNLTREEAALQESFQTEYQQIVPGAQQVDDPVRLVSSLRSRAASGNDAPQVLLQALQQLSAAAAVADAQIEAISFRSGVADIRVNAANVSILDSMRQRIDQSGDFRARIQSTDQVGERVNSRIQIQAIDK